MFLVGHPNVYSNNINNFFSLQFKFLFFRLAEKLRDNEKPDKELLKFKINRSTDAKASTSSFSS
jgi:hypothetical protein